ncbi:MAG TPA: hypothetical protein VHG93_00145 [Longimicrobium sp.]|nr:hypothetical protein [Longimicrobium sp.]
MNWLLHLWAHAPLGATVPCPAPREGEPPDPGGLYDAVQLASLWNRIAIISAIAVLVLVVVCYLLPRASLSPRFVRNWWLTLAGSMVACFLIPLALGLTADLNARAGSCSTRPAAFPVDVPVGLMMDRMFAGLVWGALAFIVLSLIGTQLLGRSRLAGGFFHYRGCPVPRWNPTQG